MSHDTLILEDFYLGCDLEVWHIPGEDYFWYNRTYDMSGEDHYGTKEDAIAAAKQYLNKLP